MFQLYFIFLIKYNITFQLYYSRTIESKLIITFHPFFGKIGAQNPSSQITRLTLKSRVFDTAMRRGWKKLTPSAFNYESHREIK